MNVICCFVNVDGVVVLFGSGWDTSTLHAVQVLSRGGVG